MISLINDINETIKESKWYDKICLIFNFYIIIPISVIIDIHFIFTEYISLKIIGVLGLCIYAFLIGLLTAIDLED
jgi:hypothetical protein